jgi:hypothetical protein
MTEKISIQGKDAWIVVEPHLLQPQDADDEPQEFFTASYHFREPFSSPGGILITESDNSPKLFESPVEAVEYVEEKLAMLA